jgi:acyl carrier protein
MARVAASEDDPKLWKLRDALKLKAKMSDAAVERLYEEADQLDLVEIAMALEEEHGIEIDLGDLVGEKQEPPDEPRS